MNFLKLSPRMAAFWLAVLMLTASFNMLAQEHLPYQLPPQAMIDLVDAPTSPAVSLSPSSEWMLLMQRPSLPGIADLAQPELRIAGLRINPRTNGPSRARYYNGLKLRKLGEEQEYDIEGLPSDPRIANLSWSPKGEYLAFTHTSDTGISLWVVEVASRKARQVGAHPLNMAMRGSPYSWLSGQPRLVYRAIPEGRGSMPEKPLVPEGPVISENDGKVAAVRTYQDLLQNKYDEQLFEYLTTAQLYLTDMQGRHRDLPLKGMYSSISPSPDGQYLLVQQIRRPFSYIVPYYRFPLSVQLYDMNGSLVRQVAELPLAEDIPKGFDAVRAGPRAFSWRADAPASLYWVEAMDGGDPRKRIGIRDQLFHLEAPFEGQPVADLALELRFRGISWGHEGLAIVHEYWRKNRRMLTSAFSPAQPGKKRVLFDRSSEDRYNDPGTFVHKPNEQGKYVLLMNEGKLLLRGTGASPEGNRPFVDLYELETGRTERLWRSEAPYYEYPVEVPDLSKGLLLTRRESQDEPPNYFMRNLKKGSLTPITHFPHPYPQMKEVKKELITYQRKDGVQLSATLYLPPGYEPSNGPLPMLMWAYPREYKSAQAAGQVSGSPYTFTRMSSTSPLMFLSMGYAVLSNPTMPIIGEGEREPNDTYVEQLVSSAAAAIDKVVEMGVADRQRIAIGGHSYGAFMTANLLAHSDLFACGIARSGAYNRTLTPFGFQAEERTFWEAPEVYFNMSPFMHAHKIREPLLLIHGEADNNSGTFPMQSKRFYSALKGHGAQVRLVMLPHESHGYAARESVMHTLWESYTFLEKHLKGEVANR